MKKLSLFLALILVLTCAVFAACGDETKKDDSDKTESTASETESTASGDGSVADGESSVADDETSKDDATSTDDEASTDDETSTGDEENGDEYMSFEMKCGDYIYVIKLLETDSEEGVFEFYETSVAGEEELAMMGMSGTLSMSDITAFKATDIKTSETSIVITGAPTSVRSEFKGEAAETFKSLYKSMFEGEDDPLSQLTLRLLDGEVLEGEDIDNYTYLIDQTFEIEFSLENDELVITQFTRHYTSWGFLTPTKDVCTVENGIVRSILTYEEDELVYEEYYDENGEYIDEE